MAAEIIGQAFVHAHTARAQHNRAAVERIADTLVERKELFGDELLELLDRQRLERPQVDLLEEGTWPKM